jgi:hypothetical protein
MQTGRAAAGPGAGQHGPLSVSTALSVSTTLVGQRGP